MTRLFTVAATLVEGDRLQPAANSRHTSAHPAQIVGLMIGRIHFTGSGRGKADILHASTKRRARLRVGIIGTGAISNLHARAYRNIGYKITVCTDIFEDAGRRFAEANGAQFVKTYEEVCRHPEVDYVDVCTFPDFRLQPLRICAETGKHVQVQKPISTNLEAAREMIETARKGG